MQRRDNDVVVRVKVVVPGASPQQPQRGVIPLRELDITLPEPFGTANVQVSGGATSGTICAKGDGAIKNGSTLAAFVFARVYPGNVTAPLKPPPLTPAVVPFGANGNWLFDSLTGAVCNADGTAANTLVTWTDFS